jgi:hypothetical protein
MIVKQLIIDKVYFCNDPVVAYRVTCILFRGLCSECSQDAFGTKPQADFDDISWVPNGHDGKPRCWREIMTSSGVKIDTM